MLNPTVRRMEALSMVPCCKPGIPRSLGSFHLHVLGSLVSGSAANALPGPIAPNPRKMIRRGNFLSGMTLMGQSVLAGPVYKEVGGLVMNATTSLTESVSVSKWLKFFSWDSLRRRG